MAAATAKSGRTATAEARFRSSCHGPDIETKKFALRCSCVLFGDASADRPSLRNCRPPEEAERPASAGAHQG